LAARPSRLQEITIFLAGVARVLAASSTPFASASPMNSRSALIRSCITFCVSLALWMLASSGGAAIGAELRSEGKPHARPQVGDPVARFEFQDTWFLRRSLDDFKAKNFPTPRRAFVLVFTNTTCPLVQRYWPRLKELEAAYRDQGVQFLAVNAGAGDSIVDVAAQAVEFGVPFPLVKDIDGQCVAACGVERTPEVVVIDAARKLRYRGRIDSQIRLGGTSAGATEHDLQNAIEDVLADRPIRVAETPVDGCRITPTPERRADEGVTYHNEIAPLMATHCGECHRPDTAAPFSLLTYDDVASNGEMIAEVVADCRMPPWYAASEHGEFSNCRAMPAEDREAIIGWVRNGMPPGEAKAGVTAAVVEIDQPTESSDGTGDTWANREWSIGEPDLVLTALAEFDVPAEGYVDYRYAVLPKLFTQDMWFAAAEVLPDNPRVVHHCNLGLIPIGGDGRNAKLVTGYVPGGGPMELGAGVAGKIPAGSMLGLQVHLTTTGKPEKCRIRVGFRFPRERVAKELRYVELASHGFKIPPHAPFHRLDASRTVDHDVTAYGMFAHMHVRGKDVTFRTHSPGSEPQTLLMIPNYSFDWQLPYYLPKGAKKYPAGTRFEAVAHFDNSAFNPYNPDPSAEVREGQQTFEEMMYGYVFYTVDDEDLQLAVDAKSGVAMKDDSQEEKLAPGQ
jgi:thiol-disulfide isomerase/thioredoxin/mono/diheme cytochrome c family protein